MNILWRSHQGASRRSNNDYVAFSLTKTHFCAVIVDSSDRGSTPARLANYWAEAVLTRYIRLERETAVALLKDLHRTLIPAYLSECASYALMDMDLARRGGELFYVGDCRLGVSDHRGVVWVNEPHCVANTIPGLDNSFAHCLTRVLKARRFIPPDRISFRWQAGDTLLLCSDGYWRSSEHDDSSVLILRPDAPSITLTTGSDCRNVYARVQ